MTQTSVTTFLGVAPVTTDDDQLPSLITSNSSPIVPNDKTKKDVDEANVREKLYELMNLGSAAAKQQFDLAKRSQQARAFEVLAKTIDTVRAVGKDILDLNKNDLPAPNVGEPQETAQTVELSPDELMEMIKRRRNGD